MSEKMKMKVDLVGTDQMNAMVLVMIARLGGQATITTEDIKTIDNLYGGCTIEGNPDNVTITLRTKEYYKAGGQ